MRAELNDLEKEMGEMIARKRYDLNRKNNTKDLAVLGKAFNNSTIVAATTAPLPISTNYLYIC